jgi:hypothetical protein
MRRIGSVCAVGASLFGPMGKPVLEVIFRESLVTFCIFSNITTIISFNTSNEEKKTDPKFVSPCYL